MWMCCVHNDPAQAHALQRLVVRAWGCLLE
jgi:hypothetical protein